MSIKTAVISLVPSSPSSVSLMVRSPVPAAVWLVWVGPVCGAEGAEALPLQAVRERSMSPARKSIPSPRFIVNILSFLCFVSQSTLPPICEESVRKKAGICEEIFLVSSQISHNYRLEYDIINREGGRFHGKHADC